jgi:hypothetical protein
MTCANVVNIGGLVANLAGVLLLFRYGMPFRVRSEGLTYFIANGPPDQREIKEDRRHTILGMLGLILIILGTAAQIAAVFL